MNKSVPGPRVPASSTPVIVARMAVHEPHLRQAAGGAL